MIPDCLPFKLRIFCQHLGYFFVRPLHAIFLFCLTCCLSFLFWFELAISLWLSSSFQAMPSLTRLTISFRIFLSWSPTLAFLSVCEWFGWRALPKSIFRLLFPSTFYKHVVYCKTFDRAVPHFPTSCFKSVTDAHEYMSIVDATEKYGKGRLGKFEIPFWKEGRKEERKKLLDARLSTSRLGFWNFGSLLNSFVLETFPFR